MRPREYQSAEDTDNERSLRLPMSAFCRAISVHAMQTAGRYGLRPVVGVICQTALMVRLVQTVSKSPIVEISDEFFLV